MVNAMDNRAFLTNGALNPVLLDGSKKKYIYSTDIESKKIFYVLLQNEVRISGFVRGQNEVTERIYNIPVYTREELDTQSSVIIVTEEEKKTVADWADEIFIAGPEMNFGDKIYFGKRQENHCNAALMLSMILSRSRGKQCFFFADRDDISFWENLIHTLSLEDSGAQLICLGEEDEKIYETAYYNPDDIMIFIASFERSEELGDILKDMGFLQTRHYVWIGNSFSGHVTDQYYGFDWFLGNTYIQNRELPGFYIHGDESCNHKIVVLGNSATDPLFYPQKAWPEFLYEKYLKQGIKVTIYNGAITDYSSSNELIKLVRDVLRIRPDIVISYSGFIDFRQYVPDYPDINLNLMRTSEKWEKESGREVIYGAADRRSAYERWQENEKIMNQVCELYHIKFYGVLQAWLGSESEDSGRLREWSENYWKVSFPQFDSIVENAEDFKEKIRTDAERCSWLYDATAVFAGIGDEKIFYDSIHVNETGNEIIADAVWEIMNVNEIHVCGS